MLLVKNTKPQFSMCLVPYQFSAFVCECVPQLNSSVSLLAKKDVNVGTKTEAINMPKKVKEETASENRD